MSRTTSEASGIAAELRDWARGVPFHRSCRAVVDQGPRRQMRGAGSAMAADRRPRNHLARRRGRCSARGCRVLRRAPHSALVEALALGNRSKMWVLWPAWTATISVSSKPFPACRLWQQVDT
jgi:hypothetical protein